MADDDMPDESGLVPQLPGGRPPLRPGTRLVLRLVLPVAVGWWLFSFGMERLVPESRATGLLALWLALFVGLIVGRDVLRGMMPHGPEVAFVLWMILGIACGSAYLLLPTHAPVPTGPDVTMHLVHPKSPAVWLENPSSIAAEHIKWAVVLCNLNDRSSISPTGDIRFVPIPTQSFDFLRPHERSGLMALLQGPAVAAIHPGDRLFGFVSVSCPNCVRRRAFWLFVESGQGGWYSEIPDGESPDMKAFAQALPEIAKSGDPSTWLLKVIPAERRTKLPDE